MAMALPTMSLTKTDWARPGFEPGTSRTRSENHTPRPTSQYAPSVLGISTNSVNENKKPDMSSRFNHRNYYFIAMVNERN